MAELSGQQELLTKALKIRLFEQRLLELAGQNVLTGTVHTCIGQELIPVTLMKYLLKDDYIFSNHRCHGHYLARFDDYVGLAQELMSSENGVCSGLGGSQHINRGSFYSSGIQGGMLGVAAGVAHSLKEKKSTNISLAFIGDGTLGEGSVYEVFNLASKWELPLLVVIEDNKYAQSTPQDQTLAGSIEIRCKAFDLTYFEASSNNLTELDVVSKSAVECVRKSKRPCVLHVSTYRLSPHSKGDDFRDKQEIKAYEEKDLISLFLNTLNKKQLQAITNDINSYFQIKSEQNNSSVIVEEVKECENNFEKFELQKTLSPRKAINEALGELFKNLPDLLMIGEDVEDPYGGTFKVSQNLSTKYPGRIKNTPISESAIVGLGIGRALTGLPTIVEIMFSDFLTLANDQLINTASKLQVMFGIRKNIPLIVRCANGPNSGYGATHSQDMSGYYQSIPFLDVYMPSKYSSFNEFYMALMEGKGNVSLVFENKNLYSTMSNSSDAELLESYDLFKDSDGPSSLFNLRPKNEKADLTMVCSSLIIDEVEVALVQLLMDELFVDVYCFENLKSNKLKAVELSLKETKRLIIIEGSTLRSGWSTHLWYLLSKKVQFTGEIISSAPAAIPANVSKEKDIFPSAQLIEKKAREVYEQS